MLDTIFFILSKVVQFCIEPLNWALLFVVLSLYFLLLRKLALVKRFLVLALLDLLIIGWIPTAEVLLRALEDSVAKSDLVKLSQGDIGGIVVLGGAIESGQIGLDRDEVAIGAAAERVTKALELVHRYPDLPLVYSGFSGAVNPKGISEADSFKRLIDEQGIQSQRVHFENQSRNTYENALYVKPIIDTVGMKNADGQLKPWILVTSASHMYRSIKIFQKQGILVLPLPVDYQTAHTLQWTSFDLVYGAQNWNRLLHELIGLVAYKITGKI
ncbi:MAG: YdcF family protein [Polynucleobacter sp.]|uniref:YdcF family protein n=1 Tax=Polynucleobacter sp. TaxID=2029855 RepID=UPI0021740B32|nr:YdcF family protein [Polynucleobacter sp.]MBU3670786.1 YdcF family protein [Polynucleobacter sp.]